MNDKEKIERYKKIVYRLNVINRKLESLNNSIGDMKKTLTDNFTIDDKFVGVNEVLNASNKVNESINNINERIIPSLNYKIYN